MERRRHLRQKIRFDTLYSTGPEEGAGVLTEISYNGARIEDVQNPPKEGTLVRMYVFVQPVAPFAVSGRVTRVVENGFAIACEDCDEGIRKLVDDVSAIMDPSDRA